MSVIKCKMCGDELNIEKDVTTCQCAKCNSLQTVPNANDEEKMAMFEHASVLFLNKEFDMAELLYKDIASKYADEPEAYWGIVLCNYGIAYVEIKQGKKMFPRCHRSSFESVFDNEAFKKAVELADEEGKKLYSEEAERFEKLRKMRLIHVFLGQTKDEGIAKKIKEENDRYDMTMASLNKYLTAEETDYTRSKAIIEKKYSEKVEKMQASYDAKVVEFKDKQAVIKKDVEKLLKVNQDVYASLGVLDGKRKKSVMEDIETLQMRLRECNLLEEKGLKELEAGRNERVREFEQSQYEELAKANLVVEKIQSLIQEENAKHEQELAKYQKEGFGRYPRVSEEELMPIEWKVLDVKDSKVLIISKYGIDIVKYHTKDEETNWEECSIRKWLNREFLYKAFNEEERKYILESKVRNDQDKEYDMDFVENTMDKIFLLSGREAMKYFKKDEDRVTTATEYALEKGKYVGWWLRSSKCISDGGWKKNEAGLIDRLGRVGKRGLENPRAATIRPAMWIDIEGYNL